MSFKRVIGGGVGKTSGPPDPTSVPGLALWLDADLGITLGVPPRVVTWADQSGNARDYTQSVANRQPEVLTADVNGKDAIRFDIGQMGAFTDLGAISLLASDIVELTMFFVIKGNSVGAGDSGTIWSHRSGFALVQTGYVSATDNDFSLFVRGTSGALATAGPVVYTSQTYQLLESVVDRNTPLHSILIDQGVAVTDATAIVAPVTSVNETLGATKVGPPDIPSAQLKTSNIGSVVAFNRILLAAETTTIRTFLKDKYGI